MYALSYFQKRVLLPGEMVFFFFKCDTSKLQKWVGKLSVYQWFDLFIKLFEFCEFVFIGRSNFEIGLWSHFHVIL